MKLEYPAGATPIDGDELAALIPDIHRQSELNQFERENIRSAIRWAAKSRKLRKELYSIDGIKLLHRRMFGDVWKWAGIFRTTDKNIGNVQPFRIPEEVQKLCDDVRYQLEQGVDNWALLAVTFHHRLVSIHPFPNGNGRHARLAADLLLQFNGKAPLDWGYSELMDNDQIRSSYIRSLKAADGGNLAPLAAFAIGKK